MAALQTNIVFNNILIISSKFFLKALYIGQRQFLSNFFLKIHRVSKVRFMRFYYLKTDFIRILLIKPHKSNFWYPMYFEEIFGRNCLWHIWSDLKKNLDDIIKMLLNTICVCCTSIVLKISNFGDNSIDVKNSCQFWNQIAFSIWTF